MTKASAGQEVNRGLLLVGASFAISGIAWAFAWFSGMHAITGAILGIGAALSVLTNLSGAFVAWKALKEAYEGDPVESRGGAQMILILCPFSLFFTIVLFVVGRVVLDGQEGASH